MVYDASTGEVTHSTSSQKYKNNISTLYRNFDDVLNIRPVEYIFKSTEKLEIGLIAEEVFDINSDFATYPSASHEPEAINWFNIIVYQNEVIKRLDREVKEQAIEINKLKEQNAEINKLKEILSRNNIQ